MNTYMKNKLSVTVITLNEEKDLTRCLESVKNIADEIVLVDSGSTDKTVDIAKKLGAQVFYRKFDNYANQKNFAAEKSNGEWILSLDADEEISPQLASEILPVLALHNQPAAYTIPRKNIIFGKFVKYSRWQPELDRHIWLWRRGKGKWVGDVHEEVVVEGEVGKLRDAKIHHQYDTVSEFLQMINRYSEIGAGEMIKKRAKFSYFQLFFQPIYNFLVRYFYRLGFLDGWRGFILSYLMAVYHLELWIKVWERERRIG